jgi:hypothetical protein
MNCPNCQNEMHCGCKNCAARNAGKVVSQWPDGNTMACGHCGHSGSGDYWLDVEVDQLLAFTGCKTLTRAGMKMGELYANRKRLIKAKEEIEQIFIDAASWNENNRPEGEPPIDPDPDGELRQVLNGISSRLTAAI